MPEADISGKTANAASAISKHGSAASTPHTAAIQPIHDFYTE